VSSTPRRLVVVGGSDAGISAGLRAREVDPTCQVTLVVADEYPNFSICGIPYYVSGEVQPWQALAHRTQADLLAAGLHLRLNSRATAIDVAGHRLAVTGPDGAEELLDYDALVVGTGAHPTVPPIDGLRGPGALGPDQGVHLLHTMDDTHALVNTLTTASTARASTPLPSAVIIGAGYIGTEMAEALRTRGLAVTVVQRPSQVLTTVEAPLGAMVADELTAHGVVVLTDTEARALSRTADGQVRVDLHGPDPAAPHHLVADVVLVVTGVRPDTDLLTAAGASTGTGGAVAVDETMGTGLADVWAAGDCVLTHHRLLGTTYLPLGTTAHKQGRVAGANAVGGRATFAGSVGTQVVKVFDLVVARTGLLPGEAAAAGFDPMTTQSTADDHKAYYPGAQPLTIRITGDRTTGRLLGAQLVGRLGSEVAKRVDTYATSIFHGMTVEEIADLDLSYTPPLGSPWDAVQIAAHAWTAQHARSHVAAPVA